MKIRTLQWNIWYKTKIDNVAELIKNNNIDIACLQEITIGRKYNDYIDTAKYLGQKLRWNHYFAEAQRIDKNSCFGNGIFSRFKLTNKKSFYLQKPKPNPINSWNEGRIYLEANIKIKNKTVNIGTTHLSFYPKFKITLKKKEEANKLLSIVKKKKSHYIFTGDLNSTPDSYTVRKLQKYLKNAGPGLNQKTWTTKPFRYGDFEENKLNWRLDYVFVSSDIKVANAQIVNTNHSDHLPILVEIEV